MLKSQLVRTGVGTLVPRGTNVAAQRSAAGRYYSSGITAGEIALAHARSAAARGLSSSVQRAIPARPSAGLPSATQILHHGYPMHRPPVEFDADAHLSLDGPDKTYKLHEFGFPDGAGFSSFAATEPFQLLEPEAVDIINEELKDENIQQTCTYSSPVAPQVMRGLTHHSRFIDKLWSSPELTSLLSASAGIALKPHPMQLERAHVNIQTPDYDYMSTTSGLVEDDTPVFGWHTDSQPFVCIVMLSEPPLTGGIGGETYVKKLNADGEEELVKLSFPGAGYAYLLQGSIIPHCAMPARNYERITMITAYVPANPLIGEGTGLGLAKEYTDRDQLGREYFQYRISSASQKATKLARRSLWERSDRAFNIDSAAHALDSLINDLQVTRLQLESMRHQAPSE